MASSPVRMSSAASSTSSSPVVVTAKKSVQALLDELSESDSGHDVPTLKVVRRPVSGSVDASKDNESSDDDILIGGGRLAARLAGGQTGKAQSKVRSRTQTPEKDTPNELSRSGRRGHSAEPEPLSFEPKRTLLLKRKRVSENDEEVAPISKELRAVSSVASPTPSQTSPHLSRQNSPPHSTTSNTPNRASSGKSKFTLLVERARKERLAHEEAENAKREARLAQEPLSSPKQRRQRGSSPADDTEEDSGIDEIVAAKRLTKDARPTRKASKKALEEMNRETQRMNRNMQLAHQARTKKKFTKEDFLTSFGHNVAVADALSVAQHTPSSSVAASDAENARIQSTPPTSPLLEPEHEKTSLTEVSDTIVSVGTSTDDFDDVPDLMALITSRRAEVERSSVVKDHQMRLTAPEAHSSTLANPVLVSQAPSDSDSGSDIEVVFEKGSKRKYAAFENLSKRKAKETESHLALRCLANIKATKDKKSTMSRADMRPALLRAARKQAQEERQAKIEKLKAAGVNIQTAEQREQDQEELEDLVERARQEDEDIRKREKELAKKDGTYVKDALDDDDSDEEDGDFDDEEPEEHAKSGSEEESDEAENDQDEYDAEAEALDQGLIDAAAEEVVEELISEEEDSAEQLGDIPEGGPARETPFPGRSVRHSRIVLDDEDEEESLPHTRSSPTLPLAAKTPQSISLSSRKIIPGLQHSDDLPIGLTQAFAATMADSQTQQEQATQEQDSMDILRGLPSPCLEVVPRLDRMESFDRISDSVPGSQTQPLGLNLGLSQTQNLLDSPAAKTQVANSQPFELTQDAGYNFSPFKGNRFAETPSKRPHSTEDTILLPLVEESPIPQRKGRLQRGRIVTDDDDDTLLPAPKTAFQLMNTAAKRKEAEEFNKKKSGARGAFDEAAEESDDEYAGLGGASDEDSGEEDEADRQMIDEDTQVGKGDEAKLAKLHADRERQSDEAAVSKLLKDITTGALRRKRGVGDDLDLSDEEDAVARRREAKRREFAKMRRELLKDEAVGKIAEDKKKQAFLKSIEDHEANDDEDDNFDQPETPLDSQDQSQQEPIEQATAADNERPGALKPINSTQLNIGSFNARRAKSAVSRKPATLAEIRDSVSFLIEEPDSQSGMIDLGLSDTDEEPEAYVNLDRHIAQAEADENAADDENEDLGDFVVDDGEDESMTTEDGIFKKPELPIKEKDRAPFSERRSKAVNVVDRLELLRQASSSTGTNSAANKMAFLSSKSNGATLNNVPSLLRRATTNSSLGSISGRENVSATGVVTNKTERGSASSEKGFVRKGANTSRNAINYQGRQNLKEEKMSARAGIAKKQKGQKKAGGFLSGLFRSDTWC